MYIRIHHTNGKISAVNPLNISVYGLLNLQIRYRKIL